MNKIKFIMPVIGLAATAGAIVPAAVSCNPDSPVEKIKITLSHTTLNIAPGSETNLAATLEPKDAGELDWGIKQEKTIISLKDGKGDDDKMVIAEKDAKIGLTATITVSLKEHPEIKPAECAVTITEAAKPAFIEIEDNKATIQLNPNEGKEYKLNVKVFDKDHVEITTGFPLKWSIDTTSSITIDESSGNLNISDALDGDTAVVTVKIQDDTTITDTIKVEIVSK